MYRLHPSIRHHIVNTLAWPRLRPLQEEAIAPVLGGEHGIFLAPTAGGKTEAASFPVFSRKRTLPPCSIGSTRTMRIVRSSHPVTLTTRAVQALRDARGEIPGAHAGRTVLIASEAGQRWYIFAGLRANVELAARLSPLRSQATQKDNLYITIDEGIDKEQLRRSVASDTPDDELTRLVGTVSGCPQTRTRAPRVADRGDHDPPLPRYGRR